MPAAFDSYKRLQEKFGLPHLNILQHAFQFEITDISDIDDIRNEISGKLFDFTEHVIEPLMWSSHYCHAIEREMMMPDESQKIFELYKQIQSLRWRNNLLTIRPDPEETARLIADIWEFWKLFNPVASELCSKFSKGWLGLKFKESVAEYHG